MHFKIKFHMMKNLSILLFLFVSATWQLSAQTGDDNFMNAFQNIREDVLKSQLGFLASDLTEGREAGTKGEYLASEYIASILQIYGVKPGGDLQRAKSSSGTQGTNGRTYFQNFILIKSSPGEENIMKLRTNDGKSSRNLTLTRNIDFMSRYPDQSVEIEAPIVFVGYGIKSEKLRVDDFSRLDLKGKFVLRISGAPEFAKRQLSSSELSNLSQEAESTARKMGAAGIIEFDPGLTIAGNWPASDFLNTSPSEKSPGYGRIWADYSLPDKSSPDNFIKMMISAKTADEIFKGTGFNIDEFTKKSESDYISTSLTIKDKTIYFKSSIKTETVRVRNVIGIIEGKDPDKVIVLGAHYDHMGAANGYTWNGADDNASGTVGVMTIAKAIMETGIKPEKTIIIALWTAEESGLLGSRYYVDNLPLPESNILLNVNFDMISRYVSDKEPNKVTMVYTESHPEFRTITETNLRKYGIDLDVDFQPSKDPPGGSDHRSFVSAGIPVMRFKPGHREQYHTPFDEVSTLNWDIMEKIVRISFANVWELANSDW